MILLVPILLLLTGCFSSESDPLNDMYSDGNSEMEKLLDEVDRIAFLFKQQRGGKVVNSIGRIVKVLDQAKNPSTQLILLRLNSGQKLLVQHNLEKSQPISGLKAGEVLEFKGLYKWNNKGGLILNTFESVDNPKQSGYLKYQDIIYQ